jgi:hypothetical protein
MLRFVFVAATAAVLLAAGALSAAAGNRHTGQAAVHGQAITSLTSGAMLQVKALDDEESAQAASIEAAKAAAAQAAAAQAAAAQTPSPEQDGQANDQSGPDTADEQDNESESGD